MPGTTPRVFALAPLPPEKCAYALARYSRSPNSIQESLEWVRTHDSARFLESFYYQYGHASIADLGHVVMCFEGISELAATELEDEQLWDGQARSSRYQDFGRSGFVTPPELDGACAALYERTAKALLDNYRVLHGRMVEFLSERLPLPPDMKPEAYQRNIAARAFDVARYLLFLGIPTGVGQITSIRTLEKQIRRMKASPFEELKCLGSEITTACSAPPNCGIPGTTSGEPVAPTLAKYVDADTYSARLRADLKQWATQNLPPKPERRTGRVELTRPTNTAADLTATLLYPVTDWPFRDLYETARGWSAERRAEVIGIATASRTRRDELPREFRGSLYAFDLAIDIGAYRDLHRHRRCQQFRQEYTNSIGYETPAAVTEAGLAAEYSAAFAEAFGAYDMLPVPANQYILPFGARSRFLFKMDLAEAEYIIRLRSGVKGHFSYREIAWEMRQCLLELEPDFRDLVEATPPWIEDPLKR